MTHRCSLNCIIPPHILFKLVEAKDKKLRDIGMSTLLASAQIRSQRDILASIAPGNAAGEKRRTIYDANHQLTPFGQLARGEGDPRSSDPAVNDAYDNLGVTFDFFSEVFDRNSLDGNGLRLDAVVHYGEQVNNAYWNGQRMLFGDGDDLRFTNFTKSLDVIAHELTHGVTDFTAGLIYHKQPGALNESMSDVFGSLVKQWHLGQDAESADWLIGPDIFTPLKPGDALRSLKAPGTAYDNSVLDKDPQPAHFRDFVESPDTFAGDFGGVHINSGIPNHAFYLVASSLGGNAWEAPGQIWYDALTKGTGPNAQFQDFADSTFEYAARLYGHGSQHQKAVRDAWHQVGIQVHAGASAAVAKAKSVRGRAAATTEEDSLAALHAKLDALGKQLAELARKLK